MKNGYLFILVLAGIALISGCDREIGNEQKYDRKSVAGCWEKRIKPERYLFFVQQNSDGSYSGSVTTYREGEAVENMELGEISVGDMEISMVTNPGKHIVFKGKLDTLGQVLNGKLYYADGSSFPFNLSRYSGPECTANESVSGKKTLSYRTVASLPPVKYSAEREMSAGYRPESYFKGPGKVRRQDALAVINRWHGDI